MVLLLVGGGNGRPKGRGTYRSQKQWAMNTKTCLWIGLGALALAIVCCIGALIGGALAGRDSPATPTAAHLATEIPIPTLRPSPPPPTFVSPPPPPPTVTPYIPPPPPATLPGVPPPGNDLQALVAYANEMQPLLVEAAEFVERDGEILKEAEEGNDAVLCDGRLAADNVAMEDVLGRVQGITPPPDAAVIHDLLLRSGDAWSEALDNVELFCETGSELYKIPGVLKFWEAGATLQDAANRFWLLLVAKGVEDWVQR